MFDITIDGLRDLLKAGLDLNALFMLDCLQEGTDPSVHIDSSMLVAWKQSLSRKGYINDHSLSPKGMALLSAVRNGQPVSTIVQEAKQKTLSDFERWWEVYPKTDAFEYKGKTFVGTRALRKAKEACRLKFEKIITEGEYSADDLIRALEHEVLLKKESSVKEKTNKMKYMQGTEPYLNQRTFEAFMESSKKPVKKVTDDHSVDI